MRKRVLTGVGVLAVAILIGISATPVMAASPLEVHIVAPTDIAAGYGEFTATGPAVDAGVMCETGVATNPPAAITAGPPAGGFRILRVEKHFDCDDGSGTFDVEMVVRLYLATGRTTARWHVVGGTGDYAQLHGTGSLEGTRITEGWVNDVYDGGLH